MAVDLAALNAAVAAHGRVARVVVAEVAGSAPREVGASMLVWEGGQSGTIGGGALEWEAAKSAFDRTGLTRHPLGPSLGQCCGGAVTLLTEVFDAERVADWERREVIARGPGEMPLSVKRVLDRARARGETPMAQLVQGWMIEPVARATQDVWVWGAGHVGRALVTLLDGVPDMAVTWIDTAPQRFPETPPPDIRILPAAKPERLAPHAPEGALHIVLTYSHALDLALCDALLRHDFAFAGVIGSDTKWARFRSRLRQLGHPDAQIDRICCPIGQKTLGKHPQAIAIGVAAQLLGSQTGDRTEWRTHSSASGA